MHQNTDFRLILRTSNREALIEVLAAFKAHKLLQTLTIQVTQTVIRGNTIDPGIQREIFRRLSYFFIHLNKSILCKVQSHFSITYEPMQIPCDGLLYPFDQRTKGLCISRPQTLYPLNACQHFAVFGNLSVFCAMCLHSLQSSRRLETDTFCHFFDWYGL